MESHEHGVRNDLDWGETPKTNSSPKLVISKLDLKIVYP